MGAKAQEAVTFLSKQTDVHLLRLLGILASGASDETGIIDPAPTRETLAGLVDCSQRTITNRLNKLVESGELEQTRMGSGPGNPSAYRILLDIPENTLLMGEKGEDDYAQKGEKGERLAQKVDRLEREMGEIKALFFTLLDEVKGVKGERVKAQGGKGEAERVKGHSLKSADDPIRSNYDPDKEEEELPTVDELGDYFTVLTGCFSNPGSFPTDWRPYLENWLDRYGHQVKGAMEEAVKVAKKGNKKVKSYTIVSPKSLSTFMANLELSQNGHHADEVEKLPGQTEFGY